MSAIYKPHMKYRVGHVCPNSLLFIYLFNGYCVGQSKCSRRIRYGIPTSIEVYVHQITIYMLTFINDFFKKILNYFLKRKNNVFDKFIKWKIIIEKQTKRKIKVLRMIIAFVEKGFIRRMRFWDITLTLVGKNEIAWPKIKKTLIENVQCLHFNASLTKSFGTNIKASGTKCFRKKI